MVTKKITGIILDLKHHKEYDRLMVLFSREEGALWVIAKGVRKITSRRNFALDILNMVTIETEQSHRCHLSGGPIYLRESTLREPFAHLKSNLAHFAAACVALQFVNRVLPMNSQHEELFDCTLDTLRALNTERDAKDTLRLYFKRCLQLLGHIPEEIPEGNVRTVLWQALTDIDPHFTLTARRTLGIFSMRPKTRSN